MTTNETRWPRLRAIMDEAIQTRHGLRVLYDTWSTAEAVRSQMYQIRKTMRAASRKQFPDSTDPSHGVSPYDGLTFWLRSTINRSNMQVIFLDDPETRATLPPLMEGKKGENENVEPGRRCTVIIQLPDGESASAINAPSFQLAWESIRNDFPCYLYIENGYTLDQLIIEEL